MSENTTPGTQTVPIRSRILWVIVAGVVVLGGGYLVLKSKTQNVENALNQELEAGRQQRARVRQLTPDEQFDRGLKALQGDGQVQSYEVAARWFRLSADRAHGLAQYELAKLLQFGLGVTANKSEARRYARAAASQGLPAAVTLAGIWETTTEGGDTDQGLLWLDAAASYGDPWAQVNLALIYLEGRLKQPDNLTALYWVERAHDTVPADTEQLRRLAWQRIPAASRRLTLTLLSAQIGHSVTLPANLP